MKFGPVPPARIAGAILAHSLTVNGQKLRKGIRLTEQHARLLSDAGLKQVIVAQLDPEDLHEDAAAQQLAAALAPDLRGLRLTAPFTGRVNILARGPGLALLDEARLQQGLGLARPSLLLLSEDHKSEIQDTLGEPDPEERLESHGHLP